MTARRVDLVFSLVGSTIPQDHGYVLYAAMVQIVAAIHGARDVGILPIRGISDERGTLRLTPSSTLRVRLPSTKIPAALPLVGKTLALDGHSVRIDVPRVAALVPAPVLTSSLVTIKLAHAIGDDGFVAPDAFLVAARKKLQDRGIRGEAHLQVIRTGPRAGQACRRVIRIKGGTHVGYAMVVEELTAEESIDLQEEGLGGRRLMGCGLFLPTRS